LLTEGVWTPEHLGIKEIEGKEYYNEFLPENHRYTFPMEYLLQ